MRPIDTTFLDQQTFGDRGLRDEVLRLFMTQAQRLAESLLGFRTAAEHEIVTDLHRLKGSARALGAASLGQEIEAVEQALDQMAADDAPLDEAARAACSALVQQISLACAQATELLGGA